MSPSEEQDADSEQAQRAKRLRTKGVLACSEVAELCLHAYLNGIVQQECEAARPTHVPLALRPSPFPRAAFEHARDVLCPMILRLYDAAARDHAWLKEAVAAAAADQKARGQDHLAQQLAWLEVSRQPLHLGIVRTDFMLAADGQLKQVETNTISAAFSCAAPRVQTLHRQMMQMERGQRCKEVPNIPVTRSDHGLANALALAHKRVASGSDACLLFVVLEDEHLLCESLIEQHVRGEDHGLRCETLTMQGCAERLSLGASDGQETPPLLLDEHTVVSTVYFRGGIGKSCYATAERVAARTLIERSGAVKCPSAGWLLAGTKVVQAALATSTAIDHLLPDQPEEQRRQLLRALTRMRPMGDAEAEAEAVADPSKFILKAEPLGVWVDQDLVDKMSALKASGRQCRDYFIMDKLCPKPVPDVTFVRDGQAIATGPGIQELGMYGVCLSDGVEEELLSCVGYLVRTKPLGEADGGVCKGVAVLDSLVLTD